MNKINNTIKKPSKELGNKSFVLINGKIPKDLKEAVSCLKVAQRPKASKRRRPLEVPTHYKDPTWGPWWCCHLWPRGNLLLLNLEC